MARQVKHNRTSKNGVTFSAGNKKKKAATIKPKPRIIFQFQNMLDTKRVLKTIQDFLNEGRIRITKTGISLIEMDPANVAMIIVNLKPGKGSIITKPTKSLVLPLNLIDLYYALKDHEKNDVINIRKSDNLIILEKSGLTQQLPILTDIDEKKTLVPELTPKVTYNIKTIDLFKTIRQADKVAESIIFNSKPNKLFWSSGTDNACSKGEIIGRSQGNIGEIGKYSIKYLKKFVQIYRAFPDSTLRFHKDYPLDITARGPSGTFRFILAPRVDID